MRLANAIIVFVVSNYLKLVLLLGPLCALWRYLSSTKYVYIILAELSLTLTVVLILFVSLALAKMDCRRLANYFLLPALLGAAYLNFGAHKRQEDAQTLELGGAPGPARGQLPTSASEPAIPSRGQNGKQLISAETGLIDSLELSVVYGLGAAVVLHLTSSLCSRESSRMVCLSNDAPSPPAS